ncbi:MAG: class I SAM-dependent methyltransferase [Pseudomonadales bacterium]|nr:class I SAM-dependent methyltransferase [Pseudomonadales bacterium]
MVAVRSLKSVNQAGNNDTFQSRSIEPMKILVFPLDIDSNKQFIEVANSLGIDVIGASSCMHGPQGFEVSEFIKLPFITEPDFEASFSRVLDNCNITHVHAPHTGVWTLLKKLKAENASFQQFKLCGPSPYQAHWLQFSSSYEWAQHLIQESFVDKLELDESVDIKEPLKTGHYAALHKQFLSIPGQCDDLKLIAFAHIARVLPKGDLIEIGSLSGRSAFAIAWLAQRYNIGNLISIDPWSNEKTEDQGEQAAILNSELEQNTDIIDFNRVFHGYVASVGLLDNVGYIRNVSAKAIESYRQAISEKQLNSPELGKVEIKGQISMLHIDGNHRYDHVCTDIATWEPYVSPGGWVLLDDYVWAFGDGPKRAGDELLNTGNFDIAFSMSDTLFLRKRIC